MVALASAVALAVVLPLAAATAGPVGLSGPEAARGESSGKRSGADSGLRLGPGKDSGKNADTGLGREAGRDAGTELGRDLGKDLGKGLGKIPGGGADGSAPGWPAASPPLAGSAAGPSGPASARCGPELTSPEGVEAQTCVLEQGNETWARTYFRNATGAPLRAVLTLMGPDGRTVQVHCRTTASDDPDGCETPRARTVRGAEAARAGARGEDPYTAVAEIASDDASEGASGGASNGASSGSSGDASEGGKLLLRSGSNSAEEPG
ncbi:hypothetical protein [Streptomyces klenkii]|uniref:hypothetical protein n=1 Tax=Streptomyces klenkii TaxID=1420899 RepID=UPI0018F76308|nr:hypothetical protein [Streptomyces klenkii]